MNEIKFLNKIRYYISRAESGKGLDVDLPDILDDIKERIKEIKKSSTVTKTIYNLKLHESLVTKFDICIMRVPGGWLYDCWDIVKDKSQHGTFIPFTREFQN